MQTKILNYAAKKIFAKAHLLTGVEQSLLLAASFVTWLDRLYLCLLFLSLLLLLFVVGHFNPLYNLLNRS